jgi:hypothetical protein
MIRMQQPSISINSHDVPGPHYRMWKTIEAAEGTTASDVARMIESMNISALLRDDTPLRNIILNCHGFPGGLRMGGSGKPAIDKSNVGVFGTLGHYNVGTIWLVACRAALGTAGQDFCQTLAKVAKTTVIASDDYQSVGAWGTWRITVAGLSGNIDEYEGTVYGFTGMGSIHRGIDPEDFVQTVLV